MSDSKFRVGDLIWAKMTGWRPWPAKVIEPPENLESRSGPNDKLHVYFFGTRNMGLVRVKDCYEYATNIEKFTDGTPQRNNKQLKTACDEIAEEHEQSKSTSLRNGAASLPNGGDKTPAKSVTSSAKKGDKAALTQSSKRNESFASTENDPFLFRDEDEPTESRSSSVSRSAVAKRGRKRKTKDENGHEPQSSKRSRSKTGDKADVNHTDGKGEVQPVSGANARTQDYVGVANGITPVSKRRRKQPQDSTTKLHTNGHAIQKLNKSATRDVGEARMNEKQIDSAVGATRLATALRLVAKSQIVDVPPSRSSAADSRTSATITECLRRGGGPVGFLLDTDFSDGSTLLNAFAALGSRLVCQLYTNRPLEQLVSPVADTVNCTFADSEQQVVSACPLIVLAIETPEIFDEVLFGAEPSQAETPDGLASSCMSELLATLDHHKVVVALCGALEAHVVADLARRVEARGARLIELQLLDGSDAGEMTNRSAGTSRPPVTGLSAKLTTPINPDRLISALKTSVAALAGDEQLCRQLSAALADTVKHCVYLGDQIGNAQRLRSAVHAQQANLVAALTESLGFLESAGLDPAKFVDLLENSPSSSPYLLSKANGMINKHYVGTSYSVISAMHDAFAFARLSEQTTACSGLAAAAHELIKRVSARGHLAHNLAALYEATKRP